MTEPAVRPTAAIRRFDIFAEYPDFYRRVFSPAVRAALERGAPYATIPDRLRAEWKPEAK